MARTTITANTLITAAQGNEFAQLSSDQPGNGLINGSMEIWQRGTTAITTATGVTNGFQADRWQAFRTGYAAGVTGSQTTGTGPCRYALRLTRAAGNTSLATINCLQNIETANAELYSGQTVTFSVWIRRGADYAGTTNLRILSGTGTDENIMRVGGFTGQTTVVSTSKTITTSWQRLSVTGTVSSTATELACQIQYTPTTATAGANDWIEFTGAQLEISPVPTPFKHSSGSIAGELATCQRYFQRHGSVNGAFLAIGYGSGTTTTNTFWSISPAMRVAPTSVAYSSVQLIDGSGGTIAVTGLALHNPTPTRAIVHVTHAINDTAHRPYGLQTTASTGYVELNAEI